MPAEDPTDYKAEIVKAGAQADKIMLARKLARQRLARGVVPELDACFEALDLQACTRREGNEAELASS